MGIYGFINFVKYIHRLLKTIQVYHDGGCDSKKVEDTYGNAPVLELPYLVGRLYPRTNKSSVKRNLSNVVRLSLFLPCFLIRTHTHTHTHTHTSSLAVEERD
jgi:hypothetical protein